MTPADRLAWLLERQKGVGASDAPNLVGVGWGDAERVYRSKIEAPSADVPEDGPLARGIALEPVVADRYAALMDAVLAPPVTPIVRHPQRPWQTASPDRIRDDGRPVELKTVREFDGDWGPSGTDRVPDGYRVQVQQTMGVLGVESCDLAALDVCDWELRVYRFAFDPDLFDWLTDVEERFWREHVAKRVPPGPEWEAQFRPEALRRIVAPGTRVDLGVECVPFLQQLATVGEIMDEAKAEYERLRDEVRNRMGRAERAEAGLWSVKVVCVSTQAVPAKPAHEKKSYTYLGRPKIKKGKK